ncbi:hypothetical protein AAMO2058_000140600 [Amorphochlora amoebiformis]
MCRRQPVTPWPIFDPCAELEQKSSRSSSKLARKPKRAKTAYNFFQQAERLRLKGLAVHNAATAKEIGLRWRTLPEAEKQRYQEWASIDKMRFDRENEVYIASIRRLKKRPSCAKPRASSASKRRRDSRLVLPSIELQDRPLRAHTLPNVPSYNPCSAAKRARLSTQQQPVEYFNPHQIVVTPSTHCPTPSMATAVQSATPALFNSAMPIKAKPTTDQLHQTMGNLNASNFCALDDEIPPLVDCPSPCSYSETKSDKGSVATSAVDRKPVTVKLELDFSHQAPDMNLRSHISSPPYVHDNSAYPKDSLARTLSYSGDVDQLDVSPFNSLFDFDDHSAPPPTRTPSHLVNSANALLRTGPWDQELPDLFSMNDRW